jgi:hypothetical protein
MLCLLERPLVEFQKGGFGEGERGKRLGREGKEKDVLLPTPSLLQPRNERSSCRCTRSRRDIRGSRPLPRCRSRRSLWGRRRAERTTTRKKRERKQRRKRRRERGIGLRWRRGRRRSSCSAIPSGTISSRSSPRSARSGRTQERGRTKSIPEHPSLHPSRRPIARPSLRKGE